MDVEELLTFQPERADSLQGTKRKIEENGRLDRSHLKMKKEMGLTEEEKERILQTIDAEDSAGMDDMALKKMVLGFEKKAYKNQEMRIKFPDIPEKFMESEIELNEMIQEMHVMATVPDLYHILVDLNSVQSMLQLLGHENTDISIAVVDLLQEMTDVDALTDSEDGANILIDALVEGQVIALLVQNMERLDEAIKEESEGVHNTLGIIENMTELRPETCLDAVNQGILQWLFKRVKAKMPFDANKLYCSEILAILLQNHDENRVKFGEIEGIDVLLQQLATYKRHDPVNPEEIEYMENLFNSLCSALMCPMNREKFLKGEGLQLMNLMLREKKMSRCSALKVLDHAMAGLEGVENCQKFVDILGLRSIFPLFMKTPKVSKKVGPTKEESEEHIISVITSMLKNTTNQQRQRLMNKFIENDHEKVDRLVELHFKYLDKVRAADEKIEKEKAKLQFEDDETEEYLEEQFYLRRLESGLFTCQLIDLIMLEIADSGPTSIKQRIMQILNMRGGSIRTIKSIMREYAGNIGDAKDEEAKEEERDKILALLEKFSN